MNPMLTALALEAHQAALREEATRRGRARGRVRGRASSASLLNLGLLRTFRGV